MEDKIRDIIKANLPEQAAQEMKLYIEQAEDLKQKTIAQGGLLDTKNKKIQTLEKELLDCREQNMTYMGELAAWEKREENIVAREALFTKKELELDLTLMTKERDCAVKNSEAVFDLVDKVFRNPVVKTTVIERTETPITESSEHQSGYYDHNGIPIMQKQDITTNHTSENSITTTKETV